MTQARAAFEDLVVKTGGTYAFNGETSVEGFMLLLQIVKDMGLDPMDTGDFRTGLMSLFNIELVNMPDLARHRFILAPNHVSDFDALVLGILHPKIKIVSKSDWTNNERLRPFLDAHYDLFGLDRTSLQSLRDLLKNSIQYFNGDDGNKHYLVFSQGTISDFNHNGLERVSLIAQRVSERTGVPIVNVFVEQVSLYHPTRIAFDEPILLTRKDDFRAIWLEREAAMQDALTPPARRPVLTHKHANNNRPGEAFF